MSCRKSASNPSSFIVILRCKKYRWRVFASRNHLFDDGKALFEIVPRKDEIPCGFGLIGVCDRECGNAQISYKRLLLPVKDTPANLAKAISIEAAELLECFQWSDTDYDLGHVKEELADVMVYCRNLLDELGLDEDEIINAKMTQNKAKYPVEKARGSAAKYDQLANYRMTKG